VLGGNPMKLLKSALTSGLLVLLLATVSRGQLPSSYRWVHGFVESSPSTQWGGHLAVTDPSGDIHAIYERGSYLEYAHWSAASGWEVDMVTEEAPYPDAALTVDAAGQPYIGVVASDRHAISIIRMQPKSQWVEETLFQDENGTFGHIEMAVDGLGNPAVAAEYLIPPLIIPAQQYILYFGLVAGAGYVPEVVDQAGVGLLGGLVMDPGGQGHVVYQKYGGVMAGQRLAFDSWQTTDVAQLPANQRGDIIFAETGYPEFLVSDSSNLFWLTWNGSGYVPQILFQAPGQVITQPRLVAGPGHVRHASFLLGDGQAAQLYYGSPSADPDSWSPVDQECFSNGLTLDPALQPFLVYQRGNTIQTAWLEEVPPEMVRVFPHALSGGSDDIHYSNSAQTDSSLYGGPGTLEGKFEGPRGTPSMQGWFCVDVSTDAVGAFGKVWPALGEYDPVYGLPANNSPRWAFIDDGQVVPGTGGSVGQRWTYGPDGFVVNSTGGLAGPGSLLRNEIWSPVITWDPRFESGILEFDAYLHDNLGGGSPGFALTWKIRSSSGEKAADLLKAPWLDRGQALYGGPGWFHVKQDLSGLIEPGATQVQLAIGVAQLGPFWSVSGIYASPAPYIDNVWLKGLHRIDPLAMALSVDLPQDSFPRRRDIDFQFMARNTIPFDIGRMPLFLKAGDPGDSTYIAIDTGDGPELAGPPLVHYQLAPNPIFDGDRTSGLPGDGTAPMDEVDGIGAKAESSQTFWRFDFPDSGFIFPGDRVHFFVTVADVDGNTAMLPADTTGYSVFPGDPRYDPFEYPLEMSFRGLPSLHSETPGDQPGVLVWFDTAGGQDAWSTALKNLGLVEGVDFDFYSTNAASAGLGNGISRATPTQLDGYATIIYTSEHETVHLLATLENGNPGDDVSVLRGWLELGGKNLVLFGDNVASELNGSATVGAGFLGDWVGVSAPWQDVRPVIDGQRTPLVKEIPGSGIFSTVDRWNLDAVSTAYMPDEVYALSGTETIAEFTSASGAGGIYSVAAATHRYNTTYDSRVLLFPFAFKSIIDADSGSKGASSLAARTRLLSDLLGFLGHGGSGDPSEVPEKPRFSAVSYPNPFNPRLVIEYSLARPGELRLEVFDIKGRLVRVLADESRPAGDGRSVWDGTDDASRPVASGTYFWRAEGAGETVVGKVALVR